LEEKSEEESQSLIKKIWELTDKGIEAQEGKFDYVGVNYYGMGITGPSTFGTLFVYPEGLRDLCRTLSKKYGKPILITENGLPNSDDDQKTAFLVLHLKRLYDGITEKIAMMKFIEEIERKKYKAFMDTFNQVNQNLATYFSKLKEGGEAALKLEIRKILSRED